jgi:hypothetical protein
MPDAADLASAISELDDGYLQVQLLLAVRRAGSQEPRRAAMWHALARLLAEEQQRRRQSTQLTGEAGPGEIADEGRSAVDDVREELRRDADAIDAEYEDAAADFPAPAGQAPLVQPEAPSAPAPERP